MPCTLLVAAALFTASAMERAPTRQEGPVLVSGRDLRATRGATISKLALLSARGGVLSPVPFQLDERTPDGDWVLDRVSPYLPEDERAKSRFVADDRPGIVDDTDELAFMASDLGDRVGPETLPPGVLTADEIAVEDPATGGQGWAYLLAMPANPPRSPLDYVSIRLPPGQDEVVTTPVYAMGYSRETPMTPSLLTCGDDTNLIDRMKVRIHVRLLRLVSLERDESDLQSVLWQYKDGPVRVIREVRSSIRLLATIQSPSVRNHSFNYRDTLFFPFQVTLPFPAAAVAHEASVIGMVDGKDLYGWRVRVNSDPRWLRVDGLMDDTERTFRKEDARWALFKGPGKDMVVSYRSSSEVPLTARFIYQDAKDTPRPPEAFPGEVPALGFDIRGVELLPRGPFDFLVTVNVHQGARQDEEALTAAGRGDLPLLVKTTPLVSRHPGVLSR